MDKLKALRLFEQVGKTGSFSETARYFDVPVSSVTRQIQALEEELGTQLLHRTTRLVKLTEIGELYLGKCRDILAGLERADELVTNYRRKPSGTLHISCSLSYGENRLVPVLAEFEDLYPDILLDLDLTDRVVDIMRDNVDIAIRAGQVPDERVVARHIDDNNFSLVASRAYIQRFGIPETVEDMREHRAIFFRSPAQVLHWQVQINNRWQAVDIRPAIIANTARVLRQWALDGKGMAMMPNWALKDPAVSSEFQVVKLDYPIYVSRMPNLGIFLLYERTKYVVPKVKAMVDFITSRLRNQE